MGLDTQIHYKTKEIAKFGGQHIGCGDPTIEALHVPTGLTASCGHHRSQHKNRLTAKAMIEYGLADLGLLEHYNDNFD